MNDSEYMSMRSFARTSERSNVDDGVRLVLRGGVVKRVGKDETTLGVGVVHLRDGTWNVNNASTRPRSGTPAYLDSDAVRSDDNVTRLGSLSTRHVLSQGNAEDHVDGDLELGDGPGGRKSRSSATHVGPHLLHGRTRLERLQRQNPQSVRVVGTIARACRLHSRFRQSRR